MAIFLSAKLDKFTTFSPTTASKWLETFGVQNECDKWNISDEKMSCHIAPGRFRRKQHK